MEGNRISTIHSIHKYLKKIVPKDVYNHFLLLFCGYRMLLSSNENTNFSKINDMLKKFVRDFPKYYGLSSVSYSVHNLLHLVQSTKEFDDLNSISAYKFENYMKKLNNV